MGREDLRPYPVRDNGQCSFQTRFTRSIQIRIRPIPQIDKTIFPFCLYHKGEKLEANHTYGLLAVCRCFFFYCRGRPIVPCPKLKERLVEVDIDIILKSLLFLNELVEVIPLATNLVTSSSVPSLLISIFEFTADPLVRHAVLQFFSSLLIKIPDDLYIDRGKGGHWTSLCCPGTEKEHIQYFAAGKESLLQFFFDLPGAVMSFIHPPQNDSLQLIGELNQRMASLGASKAPCERHTMYPPSILTKFGRLIRQNLFGARKTSVDQSDMHLSRSLALPAEWVVGGNSGMQVIQKTKVYFPSHLEAEPQDRTEWIVTDIPVPAILPIYYYEIWIGGERASADHLFLGFSEGATKYCFSARKGKIYQVRGEAKHSQKYCAGSESAHSLGCCYDKEVMLPSSLTHN